MSESKSKEKQLKILRVYFKNKLRFNELPAFRSAVSNIAGLEHILFHHHEGDGFLYKYPKIQYRISSGRPVIVCMDTAIEELFNFFSNEKKIFHRKDRKENLEVTSIRQYNYLLRIMDKMFNYRISEWLPLNQDNYKKFNQITAAKERIIFLEKILIGNIISFAKGVEWTINDEIKVNFLSEPEFSIKPVKEVKMQVFRVNFETNIFLPEMIGLGKLASIGYGNIKRIK